MTKIILNNCGKNYHRTWLFRGINIEIPILPGTSYAILGSNGAGKSTFTLMLAGQISPTEGVLSWQKNNVLIPEGTWHEYYSLASPALELPEEFTIEEWYKYHNVLKPFKTDVTVEKIIDVCEFPSKIRNKPLMHYSSGMKQRIKLCLSIFGNEPLSILDEPLTNLDSNGIDLYNKLIDESKNDKCFIIASNREDEYHFCQNKFTIAKDQQNLLVNQ
jgi:ABC-type multidrug transport system ATPase subunit